MTLKTISYIAMGLFIPIIAAMWFNAFAIGAALAGILCILNIIYYYETELSWGWLTFWVWLLLDNIITLIKWA